MKKTSRNSRVNIYELLENPSLNLLHDILTRLTPKLEHYSSVHSFELGNLREQDPLRLTWAASQTKRFFTELGEHAAPVKQGYYESIRCNLENFMDNVFKLPSRYLGTNRLKNKFMDIGSCNGEKVFVASCFFKEAYGIEISKESHDIARKALKPYKNIKLIHGDAFDMGAKIAEMDVLYCYCPIQEHKLMVELGNHIIRNMKNGAVLCEMLGSWIHGWVEATFGVDLSRLRHLGGCRLYKNKTGIQIDDLRSNQTIILPCTNIPEFKPKVNA